MRVFSGVLGLWRVSEREEGGGVEEGTRWCYATFDVEK